MEQQINMRGTNGRHVGQISKVARWFRPGEAAPIGQWVIADGMVYVGVSDVEKRASGQAAPDGCVIDPDLSVATSYADRDGSLMSYWPRYDEIDPRSRLAYLEWLSTGKSNPSINIGFVFLYFYGIERRVFIDGVENNIELDALTGEVQRLLQIYGSNNSFHGYAKNLLETINLLHDLVSKKRFEPKLNPEQKGISAATKVAIGRLLANGQAVPFDWMMSWWLEDSSTRLRVSGTRCFAEFTDLMRTRFGQHYPSGMRIEVPNSRLTLYYNGASSGISGDLSHVFHEAVPDIEKSSGPIDRVGEIAERAMDDLSAFARFVGRNPNQRKSLLAAKLLPIDCKPEWVQEKLVALAEVVGSDNEACRIIPLSDLARACGLECDKKLNRDGLEIVAMSLARLGVGIEPDPLYGSTSTSHDEKAHVFCASGKIRAEPNEAYSLAVAMTTLIGGIASVSDTGLGSAERHFLSWIEQRLGLNPVQRQRLEAHLDWLISKKTKFTHVRKLMRQLPGEERATFAALAVVIAKADGFIEQSEMKFLELLFDELGIERQHFYGVIHQMDDGATPSADEPVEIQRGWGQRGHTIPQPSDHEEASNGVTLNEDRIKQILEETHAVSDILITIFAEDDDPEEDEEFLDGLDLEHRALLQALSSRETWERADMERLAHACGLMPDGALDTINEWGWDAFGEPILENGAQILVYREAIEVHESAHTRGH